MLTTCEFVFLAGQLLHTFLQGGLALLDLLRAVRKLTFPLLELLLSLDGFFVRCCAITGRLLALRDLYFSLGDGLIATPDFILLGGQFVLASAHLLVAL